MPFPEMSFTFFEFSATITMLRLPQGMQMFMKKKGKLCLALAGAVLFAQASVIIMNISSDRK